MSERATALEQARTVPSCELLTEEKTDNCCPEVDGLRDETARTEAEQPPGWQTTKLLAQLIAVASLVMVLWNLQDASLKNANTGSRFATIEALVDHGTYNIDKSRYKFTIDKYKRRDGFISSKPPTLSTYAAGTYWVYQKITGRTIADYEGDVVWFVSLCTGWLFHLVFLLYFYKFCRLLLKRQLALFSAMMAAGFSWLGVAYATTINNHSTAATLALVGFYYAYRARNEVHKQRTHLIISGLIFGFLPGIDLPCYAFLPFAALYLGIPNYKRTLLYFVPALLPGLVCQFWLTYLATDSIKPTYLNKELKDYAGNYFRNRRGIDALNEPKPVYAFHVFLGHHGLFSMTPLFLFGAWEMGRSLVKRVRLPETLFVTAVLVLVFSFYIFRTRTYGGWSVGMRWLVPIMPLFLLYFGLWLDRIKTTRLSWTAAMVAFAVGAFHVQDGLSGPFQFSRWHNWIEGAPNRNRTADKMNLGRAHKKKTRSKTRN